MRVAIVHYWLVSMRGGEKVLEALCQLFPEADIFTHVYDPDSSPKRSINTRSSQPLSIRCRVRGAITSTTSR